jgi:hypothetical protein
VSLYLEAGWDFARIGSFSIVMTDDGGGPVTITISTGRYSHSDLSAVMGTGEYTDFATALAAAINANATLENDYSVTWAPATGTYTIAKASGLFTITGTGMGGPPLSGVAMNVLGRENIAEDVSSVSSEFRAYYSIAPAHGGKSQVSDDYEPDGLTEGGYTTGGGHFAITAGSGITFHDFSLMLEPKSAVYERVATAGTPWTYEHFFKHVRSTEPFSLSDGTDYEVFTLRPESARFKPAREVADYDGHWNLTLACYLEGRISP